jgi:superfamily II DNA or RNA helicase
LNDDARAFRKIVQSSAGGYLMKWIQRLKFDVDSKTQNKGAGYFRNGAVEIRSGNAEEVRALVHGTRDYTVEILVKGDPVLAFCECPHFMDGNTCKHIWAVLLAAEARGELRRIASQWDPHIEHGRDGLPDDADPADTDFEDDAADPGNVLHAGSRSFPIQFRKAPPPAPPVEPWKKRLTALRTSAIARNIAKPEPLLRKILYIVDIAECLAAGRLVLLTPVCRLKKNGEWSKPTFHETWIKDLPGLEAGDRRILSLLLGSQVSYQNDANEWVTTRHQPRSATTDLLIPMICATGRFFIRANANDDFKPVAWDNGPPWTFRVRLETDGENCGYQFTGYLARDGEPRLLSDALLLVSGLVFFPNVVSRFDDAGNFHWIQTLRHERALTIPAHQRSSFINELIQFPALPPMDLPEDMRIDDAALERAPHLRIRPTKRAWSLQQVLECEITFEYGSLKVPEATPAWAIQYADSDRIVRRDRASEMRFIQRAVGLGMKRNSWKETGWEVSPKHFPFLVRTLVAEGWRVEAEGKLYRRPGELKVQVASGVDWFELQGVADFEGQTVGLPELLKAVAKGENIVRLDDGSFGLVPEEWLERYRLVAGLGKSDNGAIRFARGQAGLLDALLADRPEVTFDEGFARLRRELQIFAGVQAVNPPPAFQGQLRGYQREGLGWLHFLRQFAFGGCLADDMGLGKTIQVLALLDSPERRGPVLVVVPRSLVFNWKQEAARFAPSLRVLDFTGSGRKDRWRDLRQHDLILTTYGTMRRDSPQLKDVRFDTIVLDEAQAIKNASTESAKAARLLNAEHRLALTGTPIENRLADLWSIFEFLNPGLLGSAAVFRAQTSASLSEESAQVLSRALRPFILRRTKEQVARELPPKTEQTIYCELESGQRKLYNELRDHYRAALLGRIEEVGLQRSKMQVLEALLRLRQAACHPGLIDARRAAESSAKLDVLITQVQEVIEEGHKVLVFSQFTSLLTIARSRLNGEKIAYEYLDGRTRDREQRVKRFQEDPSCMLFLISLKAGGLGLNLTAAEYVFLLDPWWNPAVEAQAIDRTHRIGQARSVFAYRLIARDTVEEKVLELQKSKRDLADAIITADNSMIAKLDRDTLETLLS